MNNFILINIDMQINGLQIYKRNQWQIAYRVALVFSMLVLGGWTFFQIISNFSDHWHWLVIATIYIITVEETFAHRICAHNVFDINTKSITYKILAFLNSANQSHGPVRYLCIWHSAHHMHADKGKADNVNWKEFWWGSASTLPLEFLCNFQIPDVEKVVDNGYRQCKNLIDDPWTKFCEKYSLTISTVTILILALLSPLILFNVLFLGRFIMMLGMMAAGICHLKNFPLSYRLTNTNDDSNNNLILHYLFLGIFSGLLQNNHHSHPKNINLGRRWWEIDTSAPIAYLLKFTMSKKYY
jgi:fatty-acid desaturase